MRKTDQVWGPWFAIVNRIIDGDTVVLDVDLGFRVWTTIHLRLAGIDAPEIKGDTHLEGRHALAFLSGLIPIGSEVYVSTEQDHRSFNRYIGWITAEPDLLDINQAMVTHGHAREVEE